MSKVLVDRGLLERITSNNFFGSSAIDELRAALSEPVQQQEPVASIWYSSPLGTEYTCKALKPWLPRGGSHE